MKIAAFATQSALGKHTDSKLREFNVKEIHYSSNKLFSAEGFFKSDP